MSPYGRTAWALGISLLMWIPVAMQVLGNRIELPLGGIYYLIALAISWVGTGIIASILNNYQATVYRVEHAKRRIERMEREAQAAQEAVDNPRRRNNE